MPANTLDLHLKPTLPVTTTSRDASDVKSKETTAQSQERSTPKKKTYISKESRVYAYMR